MGLVTLAGEKRAAAIVQTQAWRPLPEYAQQSSTGVWAAICLSVKTALSQISEPFQVCGIGFDATCSLVVLDKDGNSLSVDPAGAAEQNIILWADHRAINEAREINEGGYDVLRYVGGSISPDMETPKLLWLKRNLPEIFADAAYFFDLPDFLTWRATGAASRSTCSSACQWAYLVY